MKIQAYLISSDGPGDLVGLLGDISIRNLEDRFFGGGVRVDSDRWDTEYALFDFAGRRSGHGPGRMSLANPIDVIELEKDEFFGEDTGVALHLPSGYAAIQYNHYGPRVKAVEEYLNAADLHLGGGGTTYKMGMCLRDGAYQRMLNFGVVQEIEVSVENPGAAPGDARQGVSLGQALRAPLPSGVEQFSLSLKGHRQRGMNRDDAVRFVDNVLNMPGQVIKATVWGKEAEGVGKKRAVDLLDEHLSAEADIRPARGDRYARAERWTALERALRGWVNAGQLRP